MCYNNCTNIYVHFKANSTLKESTVIPIKHSRDGLQNAPTAKC